MPSLGEERGWADVERRIGDREVARCHYCTWKTDHPKAFRMRAHALTCENLPAEKKLLVEGWQTEKDEKKAQGGKDDDGEPSVKKVKRDVSVPSK